MNVLFLTLVEFNSLQERNIYTDLLREFVKAGHGVYVISPREKRFNLPTTLVKEDGAVILRLKIGNIQKTSFFEKGLSTLMIEGQFKKAIKEYFSSVSFNLILYSTPPITLLGAIKYVKKRDNAHTYLLLKDIFPQNALDIGILKRSGIKGILYNYFRHKEKKLYKVSDKIGCMSPANKKYLLENNREVSKNNVMVCPNSVEVLNKVCSAEKNEEIRRKYSIPLEKKVFIYGGNLGKPQNVSFIVECLKKCADVQDAFFLIVGSGTDSHFLKEYIEKETPKHVLFLSALPKEEYEDFVSCADVGLIFLDYRFTIPNFPSRLLSYMQAKKSVLCVTDKVSDVGKIAEENLFGYYVPGNDCSAFREKIKELCGRDVSEDGRRAYEYLLEHYTAEKSYDIIMNSIKDLL